jgi:hypothetical protein
MAVVSLNLDEVRRAREHDSFAVNNRFIRMVRDWAPDAGALDGCCRRGLENAPVFETPSGAALETPNKISHA